MPLKHLIWVSFEWQSSAVLFSCKRKVELLANLVARIDAGIVLFRFFYLTDDDRMQDTRAGTAKEVI